MEFSADTLLSSSEKGGPLLNSLRNINSLRDEVLKSHMQQLQNQFYAPNIQSEIAQREAATNRSNQLLPLDIQNQKNINDWYARKAQAEINSQNAMANFRNMGGGGGGVDQKSFMGLQNQIMLDNPQFTPQQANQAASAYIKGDNQLPDGTPLPPISGLGQSYLDSIALHTNTAQAVNQQRFAATTDAILEKGKELIPSVSKYAGAIGTAKGGLDAVKNSLGDNSKSYKDYMYFTRQFVPYAAGEMMRALGVNASDAQKELYQKVINPISFDQNPVGAMENYNRMVKLFKETVSKTVGKTPSQIRAGLNNMVTVLTPSGEEISLPKEGAQRLIKDHPDHKIIG